MTATLNSYQTKKRYMNVSAAGAVLSQNLIIDDGGEASFVLGETDVTITAVLGDRNIEKIIHAGTPAAVDNFGSSVSLDGDYAIIGVPNDSGVGMSNGAAYIFKNDGSDNWIETDILRAALWEDGAYLGNSVDIDGDYAIVGSYHKNGPGAVVNAGAAYIFKNDGSDNWNEIEVLYASDFQQDDEFGYSVSISGDYAVVGARYEDGGAGDPLDRSGAAYVFKHDGSDNWNEIDILYASDGQDTDYLGYTASISGDYAIVGAPAEDGGAGNPASNAGAAYIFKHDGADSWDEVDILHASDMQVDDYFGRHARISGDYAIVGAYLEDGGAGNPASDAGAAYVFKNDGSDNWNEVDILHSSDMQADDYFGSRVSLSGDYAVVGAYLEDGGIGDPFADAGAAYIYKNNGSDNWSEVDILHASDMQADDEFGHSVSILGDCVIVGADLEDGGAGDPALNAGAAYIINDLIY